MPARILDTDTVTLLRAGHPTVVRRFSEVSSPEVFVSVITIEEQVGGWYGLLRKATRPEKIELAYRRLGETVHDLGRLAWINFDLAAIAEFEVLTRQRLNIGRNDLRIAAIARVNNATVVTRNVRDFGRVPGLAVEDWSAPPAP